MKGRIKHTSSAGFTLVELMAVIAIIGVLASIAIPNYLKHQAVARQAEARVTLGQIFSGEKLFLMDQNRYTGCLSALGVGHEGRRYYASGLPQDFKFFPSALGLSYDKSDLSTPKGKCAQGEGQTWFSATDYKDAARPATSTDLPDGSFVGQTHYMIVATGFIGLDKADFWGITEENGVFWGGTGDVAGHMMDSTPDPL